MRIVTMASLLALAACGSSSYSILTRQAETPDNILMAMRGGSRVGCQVSDGYDYLLGIFIDCEDGRMVVSKPVGANMDAPGDPLEVTCFGGLSDPEVCQALWQRIQKEGAAGCGAGETGPGCGELKCSGAIEHKSCNDVLEAK